MELTQATKKHILRLQEKKYRKESQQYIVEGVKGVEEALKSDCEIVVIIVDGARRDEEDIARILTLADEEEIEVLFCGRKDIQEMKTTETFPGVQAVLEFEHLDLNDLLNNSPIVCLDRTNDPGNLGAIIRAADWFGMKNIILSEGSVDPYNPKVVRSTMGSLFHVQLFESDNLIKTLEFLKKKGYTIITLTMEGESLHTLKKNNKSVYIFGSESHGVHPDIIALSDKQYTIPGVGDAESLNVGVAAGITFYQINS